MKKETKLQGSACCERQRDDYSQSSRGDSTPVKVHLHELNLLVKGPLSVVDSICFELRQLLVTCTHVETISLKFQQLKVKLLDCIRLLIDSNFICTSMWCSIAYYIFTSFIVIKVLIKNLFPLLTYILFWGRHGHSSTTELRGSPVDRSSKHELGWWFNNQISTPLDRQVAKLSTSGENIAHLADDECSIESIINVFIKKFHSLSCSIKLILFLPKQVMHLQLFIIVQLLRLSHFL